jgi:hypothetical protein
MSNNLIGDIGLAGTGFNVSADLTVDAGAYSIGDALATVATFANVVSVAGKHAVIHTIKLAPNGAMPAIPFNLWLINAGLTTPVDKNAAFVLVAADTLKVIGCLPIAATDYLPSQTSWNCACLRNVGLEFQGITTSIYAYLVATETTAPVATSIRITLTGEYID